MTSSIKKVAIIGPESTGKSELAQQLARHYQTEWVPEYARFYLDRLDRDYEEEDLLEIAKGQLAWEDDKVHYANGYLFCDTNLIVIKIWSDHKFGKVHPWIEEQSKARKYDFYLLPDVDILWKPDPQREHPNDRTYFFMLYKNYLEGKNLPYAIISGQDQERSNHAINALNTQFQ